MRNYYATWFIRFIAVYLVVHSIASAILTSKLTMVPFYMPFILFIMFDIVIILQNYFIQVFLSRAKLGIVIALLFFALQFIVSFLASSSASLSLKTLLSIVPHCAFIFSFQNLLYFETAQMSASFSVTVNNYNLTYAILSFAGNITVFLILLWYFDQVIPS